MKSEATQILAAISTGDRSDSDRLMELVYDDFRKLANTYLADETQSNTLQPTAVVHEAFIRLVNHEGVDWQGRSHFFAVGATAMRQILVDHARKKSTQKRGGNRQKVSLDDQLALSVCRDADVLAVDDALEKLAAIDARRAQIVEMRFFAGMTEAEIAVALDISKSTVEKQWAANVRQLIDPRTAAQPPASAPWVQVRHSNSLRFRMDPIPMNGGEDSLTNRYLRTHLGIQKAV